MSYFTTSLFSWFKIVENNFHESIFLILACKPFSPKSYIFTITMKGFASFTSKYCDDCCTKMPTCLLLDHSCFHLLFRLSLSQLSHFRSKPNRHNGLFSPHPDSSHQLKSDSVRPKRRSLSTKWEASIVQKSQIFFRWYSNWQKWTFSVVNNNYESKC